MAAPPRETSLSRESREAHPLLSTAARFDAWASFARRVRSMRVFKIVFPVVAAWMLGAACFAFFLTTLDEPMPPRVVETAAPAPTRQVTLAPLAEPHLLIELDPILIVGHVAPRGATSGLPGDAWDCDAWRPLVQGDVSQRVKLCRTASDGSTR